MHPTTTPELHESSPVLSVKEKPMKNLHDPYIFKGNKLYKSVERCYYKTISPLNGNTMSQTSEGGIQQDFGENIYKLIN